MQFVPGVPHFLLPFDNFPNSRDPANNHFSLSGPLIKWRYSSHFSRVSLKTALMLAGVVSIYLVFGAFGRSERRSCVLMVEVGMADSLNLAVIGAVEVVSRLMTAFVDFFCVTTLGSVRSTLTGGGDGFCSVGAAVTGGNVCTLGLTGFVGFICFTTLGSARSIITGDGEGLWDIVGVTVTRGNVCTLGSMLLSVAG